jgi:hypothetical protein
MYGVSWLIASLEKRLNGANYKGLEGLSEAGWAIRGQMVGAWLAFDSGRPEIFLDGCKAIVGAGLLAIALGQSTPVVETPPRSPASRLVQFLGHSKAARLDDYRIA